jgi:threonine synthase
MTCPKCKHEMSKDEESLWCSRCGFIVPIRWLIEALNELEREVIQNNPR